MTSTFDCGCRTEQGCTCRTETSVDQWARAFAAAAHISRRAEPPWDQLTPEQQEQHRAEARRVLNATQEQQ